MKQTGIVIIGAGVIGLSIAYKLSKFTSDIIVLERNDSFGRESSSRNSEVIHSGLYYLPGSLKAQTCIEGNRRLYQLCSQANIPHKRLGKLLVAKDIEEAKKIEALFDNALNCGVKNLRFLDKPGIRKLEPDIKAERAFFSPDSGIIDSHALMNFFFKRAKQAGVMFSFSTEAVAITKDDSGYDIRVREPSGDSFSFKAGVVINCAGFYSDKVARMAGIDIEKYFYRIHWCKGQYFRIRNPGKFSLKHLVYPPATKISLGIHFTPDLGGGLRLGPDAEYVSEIDYNVKERDKIKFWESLNKFLPGLALDDLIPDTAGVRAKLQGPGQDFRDFVIKEETDKGFPGFINLIGIESPGLTACLSIAGIVKKIVKTVDNNLLIC